MSEFVTLASWAAATVAVVEAHARRRGDVDRYARRRALASSRRPQVETALATWSGATRRYGLIGLALGLIVAGFLVAAGWGLLGGAPVMWGGLLGAAVASRELATAAVPVPRGDEPRVARLVEPPLGTPAERGAGMVALAVIALGAVVPALVWLIAPSPREWDPAAVVAAIAVGVVGALAWVHLRRSERSVIGAPRPARDGDELAWVEALLATVVRELRDAMTTIAVITSACGMAIALWFLVRVPPGTTSDPALTRTLLLVLAVVVMVLWVPMLVLSIVGRRTANPAALPATARD